MSYRSCLGFIVCLFMGNCDDVMAHKCLLHKWSLVRWLNYSFDVSFIDTPNKLLKQSSYRLWFRTYDAICDLSVKKKSNVAILPSTFWEAHSFLRPATLPISLPGPPGRGRGGRQSRPGGPRTPWGPVPPVPPRGPVAPVKPGGPFLEPSAPFRPLLPGNPTGPRLPWKLDDMIDIRRYRCWKELTKKQQVQLFQTCFFS